MAGDQRAQPLRILLSYARQDEARVTELHDELTAGDHEVWFDKELRGGQEWWDVILNEIERCDLFVFVVSPHSVRSRACALEVAYAGAVNRPMMPLMVADTEITEAPTAIQKLQVRDFVDPSTSDWIRLLTDVGATPRPTPLLDTMPDRPKAPMADLSHAQEVVAQQRISGPEQQRLLAEMKERAPNPDERAAVVAVLDRLREHTDVAHNVAVEIDGLLIQYRDEKVDERTTELLEALVTALDAEECTPILGTGIGDWLFGSRREHAVAWAESFSFPMDGSRQNDLPQVAQFVAVQRKTRQVRAELASFYRDRLADRFPEIVDGNDEASLDDLVVAAWREASAGMAYEPHAVLAKLPCRVYVTAQATSLLSEALIAQGKDPVVDFCRWNPDVDVRNWPESPLEKEPDYVPSVQRPLVFHILGTLDAPESIVIAEDEYFDFLAEVSRNRDLIPGPVKEALADSSLLFLGFGLEDWDVRVLLRSLISRESASRLRQFQHVAAQIDLEGVSSPDAARRYIEKYFQRFREPPIDISWSSVEAFTRQLGALWEEAQ